ncbi:hypothetical protein [Cobetia sp. L2A1]|uniref:hypothetical protein n=1 Tax=Cobetia sp. L2A1 TaxID=2686360 RepID=UPI00131ADCE5|nr:hypothetical protein [Cobetia sp. L2A1]
MKKMIGIGSLMLLAIANTAQAHPGHDHGDWTSPLTHGILFASIAAVIATACYVMNQAQQKHSRAKKKDDH